MLIWFILFFIVVAISFILAYQSMSDYEEKPLGSDKVYSLFLVQKPEALNLEILEKLHELFLAEKAILSFERLFKGSRKALVLFGPSLSLQPFAPVLGLLELEDYSQKDQVKITAQEKRVLAWEMGIKKENLKDLKAGDFTQDLPEIFEEEQFWWQLILKPVSSLYFQATIRAVFLAENKKRITDLEGSLVKFGNKAGFVLLPQVYSSNQILDFYRQRTLSSSRILGNKIKVDMKLKAEEVFSILSSYADSSSSAS